MATVAELGLDVDDAVVLSESNRLVVRLTPCDLVARVAPATHFGSATREVELARRLADTDSPSGGLDPRVEHRIFERDGFDIGLWTSFELVHEPLGAAKYAQALARLHAGLCALDVTAPHVMDRVAAAERDVADHDVTPDLVDADRALLAHTLRDLRQAVGERGAPEQLLHGEPHAGNVLHTAAGPRFVDFENTARGPVEYDLAWVPEEVSQRYPGVDRALMVQCRGLVLAIIAMHRWRRDDEHPSGRRSGVAFLDALRAGPPWPAIDGVRW
jgi:hypothetical protein